MNIGAVINQMLVLFIAIALGFIACKAGMMDSAANEKLSRLVVNVCNPAMILYSVMEGERSLSAGQVFSILGISVAAYVFLYLAALVMPKLLGVRGRAAGVYRFMTMFGNVGFMGFPVVRAIFGAEAVFYASVFNLPFNLLSFTVGVNWLSSAETKRRFQWKLLLGPNVLASLVTLGLYLLNPPLPQVVVSATDMVANMTTPAAMMIIGCSLGQMPLKTIFGDWRIYAMSLLRLLVLPTLVFLAVSRLPVDPMILGIVVVVTAMPAATNTTMLCLTYGGDQQTASKGVFVSTLLSIATIPLLMWLLFIR